MDWTPGLLSNPLVSYIIALWFMPSIGILIEYSVLTNVGDVSVNYPVLSFYINVVLPELTDPTTRILFMVYILLYLINSCYPKIYTH